MSQQQGESIEGYALTVMECTKETVEALKPLVEAKTGPVERRIATLQPRVMSAVVREMERDDAYWRAIGDVTDGSATRVSVMPDTEVVDPRTLLRELASGLEGIRPDILARIDALPPIDPRPLRERLEVSLGSRAAVDTIPVYTRVPYYPSLTHDHSVSRDGVVTVRRRSEDGKGLVDNPNGPAVSYPAHILLDRYVLDGVAMSPQEWAADPRTTGEIAVPDRSLIADLQARAGRKSAEPGAGAPGVKR